MGKRRRRVLSWAVKLHRHTDFRSLTPRVTKNALLSFEAAKLVTVCSESTEKLMFLLYADAGPQLIGIHTLPWDPLMVSSEDRKMEAHQHRATVRATTGSAPGIPRASTLHPAKTHPWAFPPCLPKALFPCPSGLSSWVSWNIDSRKTKLFACF